MDVTGEKCWCRNGCSNFKRIGEKGFEIATCNGEHILYTEQEAYKKRGCGSHSNVKDPTEMEVRLDSIFNLCQRRGMEISDLSEKNGKLELALDAVERRITTVITELERMKKDDLLIDMDTGNWYLEIGEVGINKLISALKGESK